MEKKTIGKFISALRKANGMTQKELGEKLFVSDKTVSRWECDECTPELSLIPSIAEIFGITTDELLRGERNNPNREPINSEEAANKQKTKSDKQFKLMLHNRQRKYKNFTLISIGITILGLIAAMIANLAFSKGLIAFCLASAFIAASEICQICFAVNARLLIDDEDDTYNGIIQEANTKVIKTATIVSFVNIFLFAFCLPLVILINGANYGLVFEFWLGYGILFSLVALAFAYVIYTLFVLKYFQDRKLVTLTDEQISRSERNGKLLTKTLVISVSIAFLLGIGIFVLNSIGRFGLAEKVVFYNCADFKAFMEAEYDKWYEEGAYAYYDSEGNIHIYPEIDTVYPDGEKGAEDDYYPKKVYKEIRNASGEVICEYYYNPDLYKDIRFNESAHDKMPVTVITTQAYYDAIDIFQTTQSALYILIALDFVVAAVVYLFLIKKEKIRRSS